MALEQKLQTVPPRRHPKTQRQTNPRPLRRLPRNRAKTTTQSSRDLTIFFLKKENKNIKQHTLRQKTLTIFCQLSLRKHHSSTST
jgi:hypothetical protein